ncbi:MAG: hypothetical protein AB7G93_15245 [Bdellovibrionales bacterium]
MARKEKSPNKQRGGRPSLEEEEAIRSMFDGLLRRSMSRRLKFLPAKKAKVFKTLSVEEQYLALESFIKDAQEYFILTADLYRDKDDKTLAREIREAYAEYREQRRQIIHFGAGYRRISTCNN